MWNNAVLEIILAMTASLINLEVSHLCVPNCWHLKFNQGKLQSSDQKTLRSL